MPQRTDHLTERLSATNTKQSAEFRVTIINNLFPNLKNFVDDNDDDGNDDNDEDNSGDDEVYSELRPRERERTKKYGLKMAILNSDLGAKPNDKSKKIYSPKI